MIYFFLLPLFVAWIAFALCIVFIARRWATLKPFSSSIQGVCVGATIGMLLANAILAALLLLTSTRLPPHSAGIVSNAVNFAWAFTAVIGPLPATVAGWLVGALGGVWLAYRSRVRAVVGRRRRHD